MARKKNSQVLLAARWRLFAFGLMMLASAAGWLIFRSVRQSVFYSNQAVSWAIINPKGKIVVVSHQGKGLAGTFVVLPPDFKMESSANLGLYSISSLYQLGEQQQVGGGRLVKKTIQENLYIPVDRFIITNQTIAADNLVSLGWQVKKMLFNSLFSYRLASDFTYTDRIKLVLFFISQKIGLWEKIDISQYPDEKVLSDKLLYAFADKEFLNQDITIGVLNAGPCEQAGAKTVKILSSMGLHAVLVQQEVKRQDKNYLLVKDNAKIKEKSINRLLGLFDAVRPPSAELPYQADMVILLGEQYCRIGK